MTVQGCMQAICRRDVSRDFVANDVIATVKTMLYTVYGIRQNWLCNVQMSIYTRSVNHSILLFSPSYKSHLIAILETRVPKSQHTQIINKKPKWR